MLMDIKSFRGTSLGLVLLASACAANLGGTPAAIVLINETKLKKVIEVMPAEQGRTATGTLKIWVVIKNKSDRRVMLEARALFSGERNEVVEPVAAWTHLFIEPHTTTTFEALSMSGAARKFVIEVREGNQ